jgi:hypothetical protein
MGQAVREKGASVRHVEGRKGRSKAKMYGDSKEFPSQISLLHSLFNVGDV